MQHCSPVCFSTHAAKAQHAMHCPSPPPNRDVCIPNAVGGTQTMQHTKSTRCKPHTKTPKQILHKHCVLHEISLPHPLRLSILQTTRTLQTQTLHPAYCCGSITNAKCIEGSMHGTGWHVQPTDPYSVPLPRGGRPSPVRVDIVISIIISIIDAFMHQAYHLCLSAIAQNDLARRR